MCVRKGKVRRRTRRARRRYCAAVTPPEPLVSSTRVDPWLGTITHVVASRQDRPNLPSSQCPFCPDGIEARTADAPVRGPWTFVNRWPAMPDERCEIVVYDGDHRRSL